MKAANFSRSINNINISKKAPPPCQDVSAYATNNYVILYAIFSSTVLPAILPQTLSLDLHTRHGSLLCAAEITHALYCYGVQNKRFVLQNIFTIISFHKHFKFSLPVHNFYDTFVIVFRQIQLQLPVAIIYKNLEGRERLRCAPFRM